MKWWNAGLGCVKWTVTWWGAATFWSLRVLPTIYSVPFPHMPLEECTHTSVYRVLLWWLSGLGFNSSPDSYIDAHLTSKIHEDWGSYLPESSLPGLDMFTRSQPSALQSLARLPPLHGGCSDQSPKGPLVDPSSPFPSFSLQHWTRLVSSLL